MARWAVITYGRAVDRAAEVRELQARLKVRGLAVAGFAQEKSLDGEGRTSLALVRLGRSDRAALGASGGGASRADPERECSYSFDPGGFSLARRWLEEDAAAARVLVLSEMSKLEAGGQGHHGALTWALSLPNDKVVVFAARAEQLTYLVEKLAPPGEPVAWLELPSAEAEKDAFASALAASIR